MKNTPSVVLGVIHIFVGLAIIFALYVLKIDLVALLSTFATVLPAWTLIPAGFVEGIYGVTGLIPGSTYMFLYVLGQECTIGSNITAIAFIWTGVATGIATSYAIGFTFGSKNEVDVVDESVNKLQKFSKRLLFGLYPTAATVYLFESGFRKRKFFPVFLPVVLGGMLILIVTVPFICASGDFFKDSMGEVGILFGAGLIAWGSWKILNVYVFSKNN